MAEKVWSDVKSIIDIRKTRGEEREKDTRSVFFHALATLPLGATRLNSLKLYVAGQEQGE